METLLHEPITLYGQMQSTPYGQTFAFESYELASGENELFYFLTKVLGGITEASAREITERYGNSSEFERMLQECPAELLKIKGIGKKKQQKILQGWDDKRQIRALSEFLLPFGITNKMIFTIYDTYKEHSVAVLQNNPYKITEIRGIGFKKADAIARKIGVAPDSEQRLQTCMEYCLQEYMIGRGDTLMEKGELFERAKEESCVEGEFILEREDFEKLYEQMLFTRRLVETAGGWVSLPRYEQMEKAIIEILRQNLSKNKDMLHKNIEAFMKGYEKSEGVTLGEKQKQAIELGNSQPNVFAITGYAGTGKTTTSKAILQLYEQRYGRNQIICCALSGVAANRIKKQSGYEAMTIHSLLSYNSETGGFVHNADKPIPKRVILVDETSMVDIFIFFSLLQAIDFSQSVLIMLGDPAQLPPVGAAEIFSDALDQKLVRGVTLDTIYRQKEDAVIKLFAQEVRFGNVPENYMGRFSDFYFIDRSIPDYWQLKQQLSQTKLREYRERYQQKTVRYIQKLAERFKPEIEEALQSDPWEALTIFQVVTPMKETLLGTKHLNGVVQEVLTPKQSGKHFKISDRRDFRVGDKVLHLQNKTMEVIRCADYEANDPQRYENRVFNGQVGLIKKIDLGEDEIHVLYPNEEYYAIYSKTDFKNGVIDLGYAISGHKSQGSEYRNTVIPMTMSHYVMLNNKLLYTMMTRARERLVLVGEKEAFELGCRRADETRRNTFMKQLESKV